METTGVLGCNVYWGMNSDVQAGQTDVEEALATVGFSKKVFPFPSGRALTARAVYSFQDRRHKKGRRIVEKAREDVDRVVYGVLGREEVNGSEVAYGQNTTVRFDKSTGTVEADGALADDVRAAVASFAGKVTDYDLRLFLRRVINMARGVAKRPSGGIYFVPLAGMEVVERAARFVGIVCGDKGKMYVERVMNGEVERANVWDSVEHAVSEAVEDALKMVAKVGKRVSSAKGYKEDVEGLKGLVDEYERLLGAEAKAESIRAKLADAEAAISQKIMELQEAAA